MINKKILSLVVIVVSFISHGMADAQSSADCIPGEYVMTTSSIRHLKEKMIDEVADFSDKPVVVAHEGRRSILFKVYEPQALTTGTSVVSTEKNNELCSAIRHEKRKRRRRRAQNDGTAIIRSVSCSCNAVVMTNLTPNDSYYGQQWGLNQSNDIDVDAPEAWELARGSRSVVVAVIDSGVEYTHSDMAANMWHNPGETAGNGIDDDHNGFIDDYYGYDFANSDANPLDDQGHGTHCSGIIGGVTDNWVGIAGVNKFVSIMAIKAMDANGRGTWDSIIRSIDYATMMREQYGINIVVSNNSYGGSGTTYGPLADAIMRHQNAGILFVAAAGNSSANLDTDPQTPAEFGADSVVAVAALDKDGALASFSNYSATKVDLGAPGYAIASTIINGQYASWSGTSMAAPFVSGAAALIASAYPGITWQNLKQLLLTTGKPLSSLSGKTVTGKMLKLPQLLNAASQIAISTPTPRPTATFTPTPRPTSTMTPSPTPTIAPTLAPGYWKVAGVISGNNIPIANAVVRLQTSTGTYTRMTDSSGNYRFSSVFTSPSITVTVEASGFTFQPYNSSLGSDKVIDLNGSSLQFTLRGKVVTASGSPVTGIAIDGGTLGALTTNAQGIVDFRLPYGTMFTLQASGNASWTINEPLLSGIIFGNTTRKWIATAK